MIDTYIKDKKDCTGCFGCFSVCPAECIEMKSDYEGFWYPKVDYNKCIKCQKCIAVCPIINPRIITNNPVAFAVINKNEAVRGQSSSGGVFTLLAEYIIDHGGVVFGAKFDDYFNVVHSFVENKDDLALLRGSKYVQSKIGHSYIIAKDILETGRKVLFSGTPCQIAGLRHFLNKDYENLLCLDIICHGVPSPKIWEKYIKYREKQANSKTTDISFRNKRSGWKIYSIFFKFLNNTEYTQILNKDPFMEGFLKNLYLRPSCYDCKFKSLNREGDITLGDFWGINNLLPEMDDNKGTSLVIFNNQKGEFYFNNISTNIVHKNTDLNLAISYNSAAIRSAKQNPKRELFFRNIEEYGIQKAIKKYTSDSYVLIIKRKLKKIIKKIL
ncbi:MAG: Coenzyme F420 hydrogenase/dehydrogenase, beta subunit C-terminal domain [Bacteroidales bacterium]